MNKIKRTCLKPCPFCGEAPYWDWDKNKARCSNKHTAWMPVDEWNSRPEEDRMRSTLQRFMELDIDDPGLKDELWCIQQEEALSL